MGDTDKEISFASIFLFSRFRLLWEEEVSGHGIDKASVLRAMLRFQDCCFSAASVLGPVSGRLGEVSGLQALEVSMLKSMPRIGDAFVSQLLLRK